MRRSAAAAAVVMLLVAMLAGAASAQTVIVPGCTLTNRPGFGLTGDGHETTSVGVSCQNEIGQSVIMLRYAAITACFIDGTGRVCRTRFGRNVPGIGVELTLPCVAGGPRFYSASAVVQLHYGWMQHLAVAPSLPDRQVNPALTCTPVT